MNDNIQRAILATFLWSNDLQMDTKDAFEINPNMFNGDMRLIAAKVNEVTQTDDKFYSLLNLELEKTSPREWLEIAQQTPLTFSLASKYYSKLKKFRGTEI